MQVHKLAASSVVLIVCALTACASAPPPKEALAQADLAVQEAARDGASQADPTLFSTARDKYDRAVRAMDDDRNVEARRLAEEALVEARLARVRAEAAKQRGETQEMRKTVDELKSEMGRKNPPDSQGSDSE